MEYMKDNRLGGKIILTGTESSLHGGSEISLPYAVAKRGTECLVQGLAREGANYNILVNGLRMGYVKSGFHERWHKKTEGELEIRANLVPLKRGGHPDEAASMIAYLLSSFGDFINAAFLVKTLLVHNFLNTGP